MGLIEFIEPDFRFENENGILVQLVHDGWKQVNAIFSLGGKKRGGHYHKYNKEAFYVVSGSFKLVVWNNNDKEEYWMKKGDMFVINEYVFHTFDFLEDTLLVSMYSNGVEFDFGKDIWAE